MAVSFYQNETADSTKAQLLWIRNFVVLIFTIKGLNLQGPDGAVENQTRGQRPKTCKYMGLWLL